MVNFAVIFTYTATANIMFYLLSLTKLRIFANGLTYFKSVIFLSPTEANICDPCFKGQRS